MREEQWICSLGVYFPCRISPACSWEFSHSHLYANFYTNAHTQLSLNLAYFQSSPLMLQLGVCIKRGQCLFTRNLHVTFKQPPLNSFVVIAL